MTKAMQGSVTPSWDRATVLKVCAGMHSIYKAEARIQRGELAAPGAHLRPDPDKTAETFAEIFAFLKSSERHDRPRTEAPKADRFRAVCGDSVKTRLRIECEGILTRAAFRADGHRKTPAPVYVEALATEMEVWINEYLTGAAGRSELDEAKDDGFELGLMVGAVHPERIGAAPAERVLRDALKGIVEHTDACPYAPDNGCAIAMQRIAERALAALTPDKEPS